MGARTEQFRGWWIAILLSGTLLAGAEALQDYLNRRSARAFEIRVERNRQMLTAANDLLVSRILVILSTRDGRKMPNIERATAMVRHLGNVERVQPSDLGPGKLWESERTKFYLLTSAEGGTTLLGFFNGEWNAAVGDPVSRRIPSYFVSAAMRPVRMAIVMGWVVVLIRLVIRPTKRPQTAKLLLAVSILYVLSFCARIPDWDWSRLIPRAGPQGGILLVPLSACILVSVNWIRKGRNLRLCRQCHYDLLGNMSEICPECGKPLEHAQTKHIQKLWELTESERHAAM